MAILGKTSLRKDVLDELRETASFREDASVAKALRFRTAFLHWTTQQTARARKGGEETEHPWEWMNEHYKDALDYITANRPAATSVRLAGVAPDWRG